MVTLYIDHEFQGLDIERYQNGMELIVSIKTFAFLIIKKNRFLINTTTFENLSKMKIPLFKNLWNLKQFLLWLLGSIGSIPNYVRIKIGFIPSVGFKALIYFPVASSKVRLFQSCALVASALSFLWYTKNIYWFPP